MMPICRMKIPAFYSRKYRFQLCLITACKESVRGQFVHLNRLLKKRKKSIIHLA